MSERNTRTLNQAATVAFGLLVVAVVIFGASQAYRFLTEEWANWPLSYEGTPQASTEMTAHTARAKHALMLVAVDGAVGWAGVTAFAAMKRISGLAWTAAIAAIIFLLFAAACVGA